MKRLLPLLTIAALMTALAFWLLHSGPDPEPPPGARRVTAARPAAVPIAGAPAPSPASAVPTPPAEPPPRKRAEHRAAAQRPSAEADALGQDQAQQGEPKLWPLDPHGIKSALREAMPELERCYQQAREQDPTLPGRITVGFTIGSGDTAAESAQVVQAHTRESSPAQQSLDACLLHATASLQFERPAGGSKDVLLPFTFSSEE